MPVPDKLINIHEITFLVFKEFLKPRVNSLELKFGTE